MTLDNQLMVAHAKYRAWTAKFESFVVGVYDRDFRRELEWAVERQDTVKLRHWQAGLEVYYDASIESIDEEVAQLHEALQRVTVEVVLDFMQNAHKVNGQVFWLGLTDISLALTRLGEAVSRCERRRDDERQRERLSERDDARQRERLSESLRMSVLDSLLPVEPGEYLIIDPKKLDTFELLRREVVSYLDTTKSGNNRDAPPTTETAGVASRPSRRSSTTRSGATGTGGGSLLGQIWG